MEFIITIEPMVEIKDWKPHMNDKRRLNVPEEMYELVKANIRRFQLIKRNLSVDVDREFTRIREQCCRGVPYDYYGLTDTGVVVNYAIARATSH